MKITNKSKKFISFFNKFNCLPHIKQTKATNTIFKHFFHEINEAMNFVSYTKKQMGHQAFYNLKLNKIEHINQIPKPSTFNSYSFPSVVRKHIDDHSLSSLSYSFNLFERNIIIHFIIEDNNLSVCTDTRKTWGAKDLSYKINNKFFTYYKYTNVYPHAGAGQRVQF
jgi:hypothetical protein